MRAGLESIAVVGIGCRFPGASGPRAFWQLLRQGVDAIREAPADRPSPASFDLSQPGSPPRIATHQDGRSRNQAAAEYAV